MSVKNITQQPVRLYTAPYYPDQPPRPFRITNLDNTKTIYLDDTTDINTDSTPLPPQATITYSGNRDVYASSLSPTSVLCDLDYDSLTWDNPVGVQIALNALGLATQAQQVTQQTAIPNNIAVTGAPPLVFKRVIDVQVGTNINAGATLTRPASGQFSLNQPGYEISLNVATLGATAPILSVELQWFDSSFGALMDDEIYYFYSGNVNGHFIHGRGPSKGDQVVVIVKNFGASAVSFTYTLLQTSRVFTREFWKTITQASAMPVYPGLTAATMNVSSDVVANVSQVVNAGVINQQLVLPLYTGTVRLYGTTSDTVAGNSQWTIADLTDAVASSANSFQGKNGQSGFAPAGISTMYAADIALPRGQCTLINGNTGASNQTLTTTIVAQEDRA